MILFLSKIVSSLIEIVFFSFVPFLWWACTARKTGPFLQWVGLKKISIEKDDRKRTFICGLIILCCFLLLSVYMLNIVKNVEAVAVSEFSGLGIQAVPAILVYGVFNTALPEEILFRGFLLKRLSSKLGFAVGNSIQALLFGVLHGIMLANHVSTTKTLLIIVFTGGIAWFMGYVNEEKAGGSILPGWVIHAVSNVFSGICSAFLLFR